MRSSNVHEYSGPLIHLLPGGKKSDSNTVGLLWAEHSISQRKPRHKAAVAASLGIGVVATGQQNSSSGVAPPIPQDLSHCLQ